MKSKKTRKVSKGYPKKYFKLTFYLLCRRFCTSMLSFFAYVLLHSDSLGNGFVI